MSNKKSSNKIIANASWIIVCRLVQAVLNLFISMFTARFLGPSNFGIINYAESIVTFVLPVMQLGFTGIIVHELINNRDAEGEIIGTSLVSCVLSGIACMFGISIFVGVVNFGETETIVASILYSFMILAQAFEMVMYWFESRLMSKYTAVITLMAYVVVSIYKIFLLVSGKSIYWFAVSNAIDHFIIGFGLLILYKKLNGEKLSFSMKRFKKMFASSKYYILSGMMVAIFSQTDRMMLKLMVGNEVTGLYSAAVRCAGITGFLFTAVINSAVPVIYASKEVGQKEFEENVKNLYSIILYLAIGQSVFITLFSKYIIYILYGEAYMDAVATLSVVTWYIVFSYMGSIRNRWMLAEGLEHLIWKIDLSGAIANVVLNFILIPNFGMMGAAVASLVTQFFTNFVLGWIIKDVRRNNELLVASLNPKILMRLAKKVLKR